MAELCRGLFQMRVLAYDPYLTAEQIDASFDTAYHLKHVDTIFRRVFGD